MNAMNKIIKIRTYQHCLTISPSPLPCQLTTLYCVCVCVQLEEYIFELPFLFLLTSLDLTTSERLLTISKASQKRKHNKEERSFKFSSNRLRTRLNTRTRQHKTQPTWRSIFLNVGIRLRERLKTRKGHEEKRTCIF